MKKLYIISILIITSFSSNAQWQQTGLDSESVNCFAVKGDTLFAGTDSGLYYSANNGVSWNLMNMGISDPVLSLAIDDSIIFVGTADYGVYSTSNNGNSWSKLINGLAKDLCTATYYGITALSICDSNIFAGTFNGIYLSTNKGYLWVPVDSTLAYGVISSLVTKGDTEWIGTYGGGIFLSSNNEISWEASDTGLTNDTINAMVISGNNIFAGTNSGVFKSANHRNSWVPLSTGFPNYSDTVIYGFAASGDTIFAGTEYSGVYLSSNNGNNWSSLNNGLDTTANSVLSLIIKGNYIYAGTQLGVWKHQLYEVTGIKEINNDNNITVYPNPADKQIQIISNPCSVNNVELYNLLGEIIYSSPAAVNQSPVTINIEDIPSGVYIVKVETEKGEIIKKFVKE
jgi:ligand-binding sensor domain-containing protein